MAGPSNPADYLSASNGTKPADKLPEKVAKPTTKPETQSLKDCVDFNTLVKVDGAHIYTRTLPGENGEKALRIDGPGDSALTLDSKGTIRLITGIHDPNRGAGSGKLLIKSNGQQQRHTEPSTIEYNAGGENKDAWNVLAYGDVVHEARGSEYTIRAQKITLIADEELSLIGHGGVKIQAGQSGKGTIDLVCGSYSKTTVNNSEAVSGQKLTEGVSEESVIQFDPRASVNVVSAGSINHKVLGSLQQDIGGAYSVKTAGVYTNTVGGAASISAGGAAEIKAGGNTSMIAGAAANITAGAAANITAGEGVDIFGGANVSIRSEAEVSIKGTMIYLN